MDTKENNERLQVNDLSLVNMDESHNLMEPVPESFKEDLIYQPGKRIRGLTLNAHCSRIDNLNLQKSRTSLVEKLDIMDGATDCKQDSGGGAIPLNVQTVTPKDVTAE